jgi:DNA-binding transcriptional ArsR family regulator
MKTKPDLKLLFSMASFFGVLSDPTRLKILYSMLENELQVSEIAELVGMSISATSHQLKVLRNERLVRSRKDGRKVFYRLDDYHIPALMALASEHSREPLS